MHGICVEWISQENYKYYMLRLNVHIIARIHTRGKSDWRCSTEYSNFDHCKSHIEHTERNNADNVDSGTTSLERVVSHQAIN